MGGEGHDDHDKGGGDNDIVSRDYLLPESDKWPKAQDSTVQTNPGETEDHPDIDIDDDAD